MLRICALFAVLALSGVGCAPVQAQPTTCADQVKKLQNSPELRVQGGGRDQKTTRAGANLYLQQAAQAAAQNDEKQCREQLNKAQTTMFM